MAIRSVVERLGIDAPVVGPVKLVPADSAPTSHGKQTKKTAPHRPEVNATPLFKRVPPSCYSPTRESGSTIAEVGLNFRVRDGNGCGPHSMDGGKNNFKYLNQDPEIRRDIRRVGRSSTTQ